MEYVVTDCNAYILTNYSEECHTSYRERCSSLQSLLGDVSIQYQNLLITFAIGSPYDTPKDIWKAFESAEDAIVLRIYAGSSKLIEHRKLRAALPDTPDCKFSAEDSQALIRYIETLQKDAALALIRSVYGAFRTMESYRLGNLFRVTRTMILRRRKRSPVFPQRIWSTNGWPTVTQWVSRQTFCANTCHQKSITAWGCR